MSGMSLAAYSTEFCEDLSKYKLLGADQLDFVRKEVYKIGKLHFAQQVHTQLIKEIQILQDVLLDTEIVIGDMLKELPKRKSRSYKDCHVKVILGPDVTKSKSRIVREIGLKPGEARRCELLSEEKQLVNWMRYEAEENDKLATAREIMRAIREKRGLNKKKELSMLPLDPEAEKKRKHFIYVSNMYKKFSNALMGIQIHKTNEEFFRAMSEFYVKESTIEFDIKRIGKVLTKLVEVQNFLMMLLKRYEPEKSPGSLSLCESLPSKKVGLLKVCLNKIRGK